MHYMHRNCLRMNKSVCHSLAINPSPWREGCHLLQKYLALSTTSNVWSSDRFKHALAFTEVPPRISSTSSFNLEILGAMSIIHITDFFSSLSSIFLPDLSVDPLKRSFIGEKCRVLFIDNFYHWWLLAVFSWPPLFAWPKSAPHDAPAGRKWLPIPNTDFSATGHKSIVYW